MASQQLKNVDSILRQALLFIGRPYLGYSRPPIRQRGERVTVAILGSFLAVGCLIGSIGLFIEHVSWLQILLAVVLVGLGFRLAAIARSAWRDM